MATADGGEMAHFSKRQVYHAQPVLEGGKLVREMHRVSVEHLAYGNGGEQSGAPGEGLPRSQRRCRTTTRPTHALQLLGLEPYLLQARFPARTPRCGPTRPRTLPLAGKVLRTKRPGSVAPGQNLTSHRQDSPPSDVDGRRQPTSRANASYGRTTPGVGASS